MIARSRILAVISIAVVVSGCTAVPRGHGSSASSPSNPARSSGRSASGPVAPATPNPTSALAACPTSYAAPDPNRPRVVLTFAVSADLAAVSGTEAVDFTPDKPITELVFRLTANTAPTVLAGNRIVVTSARADHGAGPATFTRAGADPSTQGGLLHVPFGSTIAAGTTVHAELAFRLALGGGSFDRYGRTGSGTQQFAWFGSAQPLLAWERGYGWHSEDMIKFVAESATSEAMDTTLAVTAPAGDTVIMSGDPMSPSTDGATRTWRSSIAAARDVSVAVGPFSTRDATVAGVRLRVGAYSPAARDALLGEFTRAITGLSARFGPFPFPSLSVARMRGLGGGIEYPSSILLMDGSSLVAVHETAHQWFYAMLGDSQALHPWMDEAFAVYSEELVNNDAQPSSLNAPGTVDRSTESYGADAASYYFVTYNKGSAALLAARQAAGAVRWDAAMRCYVNRNAWRIVNPSDFAAAVSQLPAALAVLRKAGALP